MHGLRKFSVLVSDRRRYGDIYLRQQCADVLTEALSTLTLSISWHLAFVKTCSAPQSCSNVYTFMSSYSGNLHAVNCINAICWEKWQMSL